MNERNGFKHFDYNQLPVACTVAMLRQVYDNLIMFMRREWLTPKTKYDVELKIKEKKRKYGLNHNVNDDNLAIGRFETSVAAFHCTWYIHLYKIYDYLKKIIFYSILKVFSTGRDS